MASLKGKGCFQLIMSDFVLFAPCHWWRKKEEGIGSRKGLKEDMVSLIFVFISSGQELWWVGWYYYKHHRKLELTGGREHLGLPDVVNAVDKIPLVLQ